MMTYIPECISHCGLPHVLLFSENATTGELKIVRMSACSAPCTGGTEIWLLVEKVRRSKC